ncbi:hypothetical protein GW7_01523 [Heterocephalus glaber]|uniref:Uncharacterized protein n=1 Tax=Heterocephalus glaber TaxID=10181 RepID=G5BSP8_HETGA|nr:hypothetical protein GW7_01523 [Heterocephalus glaber]
MSGSPSSIRKSPSHLCSGASARCRQTELYSARFCRTFVPFPYYPIIFRLQHSAALQQMDQTGGERAAVPTCLTT